MLLPRYACVQVTYAYGQVMNMFVNTYKEQDYHSRYYGNPGVSEDFNNCQWQHVGSPPTLPG